MARPGFTSLRRSARSETSAAMTWVSRRVDTFTAALREASRAADTRICSEIAPRRRTHAVAMQLTAGLTAAAFPALTARPCATTAREEHERLIRPAPPS